MTRGHDWRPIAEPGWDIAWRCEHCGAVLRINGAVGKPERYRDRTAGRCRHMSARWWAPIWWLHVGALILWVVALLMNAARQHWGWMALDIAGIAWSGWQLDVITRRHPS